MVCSTAILSSSLALSLLRHSSPPSQSFVFSPFSLNTALSIVHDGANGETQKELTNLLLNGYSPSDVTAFYSSLALSLPSSNETGVAFKSANRFYISDKISLHNDYQKHGEDKYKAKVESLNLGDRVNAASEVNKFVEGATNGKIKNVLDANQISEDSKAILINAIYFFGKWKYPFEQRQYDEGIFFGVKGPKLGHFMKLKATKFRVNKNNDIGTLLIMPYLDENYGFFYLMTNSPLMANNGTTIEKMRDELTGDKLVNLLRNAKEDYYDIEVPKFKIDSKLNGVEVLKKLGVQSLFEDGADLFKISSLPLKVSTIQHDAVIEVAEKATEAAAATVIQMEEYKSGMQSETEYEKIIIDRTFLFGIIKGDDVLFLGQFV